MKIKTKKRNEDGIVKLETSGELKEIILNEDFLGPDKASIALCFRGKNSSGIVELTLEEINFLNKELIPKMNLLKGVKILKFRKE
jgi:hypothetical protein